LKKHLGDFCETCQQRFEKNILRLFDCKVDSCQNLLDQYAPSILDHLSNEDVLHFEEVQALLNAAYVPFEIDSKLVRGLDYYTRTTFEITSSLLGSQDAVCGGGRYDHLSEDLDGPPTPAVGVASGMERLLMILNDIHAIPAKESKLIYTAVLGDNARQVAFNLVSHLRSRGYPVEMDFMRRSLKAQMRDAGKKQAKWVIIIGTDEIQNDKIVLKNMASGEQKELQLSLAADQIESIVR